MVLRKLQVLQLYKYGSLGLRNGAQETIRAEASQSSRHAVRGRALKTSDLCISISFLVTLLKDTSSTRAVSSRVNVTTVFCLFYK